MTMNPLDRLRGNERKRPGEHLVECDPEGIQITPGIDRPIHASGLFRRHVSQGASNYFGRFEDLVFSQQLRSDPKTGKPHSVGALVDQNVGRFNIFMNETLAMKLTEPGC